MNDLIRKGSLLNEKISQLASEFNAEDSQMRKAGSTHLMNHQKQTVRLIMLFGLAAFILAVFFFWLLHRDLKKRHKNQLLLEQSNQHNEELRSEEHTSELQSR